MNGELDQYPKPIEPLYSCTGVNEPISLYEGNLLFEQNGESFSGHGIVQFKWLPTPRVWFAMRCKRPWNKLELGNINGCSQSSDAQSQWSIVGAMVSAIQPKFDEVGMAALVSGHFSSLQIGGGDGLSECIFVLPNFTDILGQGIKNESGSSVYRGRVVLEAQEWRVTIDKLSSCDSDFYHSLRDVAGYAVTHIGKIQRQDGSTFSSEEAKLLIADLVYFLSFCRGLWVAPLLPIGLGQSGNRVWEEWRDWPLERWQTALTWCNHFNDECIVGSFKGMLARIRSPIWVEPVRLAIWWYLASNKRAGECEGSIIIAQVALELLSWTYLVEDTKRLSKRGFEQLPASDKLRLLLAEAKIDLSIPVQLSELAELATSQCWQDGPHALTEIRNGTVHPEPRKRKSVLDAPPRAIFDAWNLANWYLELILLWLFDYGGKYSNRLTTGVPKSEEVERVPWRAA